MGKPSKEMRALRKQFGQAWPRPELLVLKGGEAYVKLALDATNEAYRAYMNTPEFKRKWAKHLKRRLG